MKPWLIRLSPSGAPISEWGDVVDMPFDRSYAIARSTSVYEAPATPAAAAIIEDALGQNDALVRVDVPADYPSNRVRLSIQFVLQALFTRETGDAGVAGLEMDIEVRVDAGPWEPCLASGPADPLTGNGRVRYVEQHDASETDAEEVSESFAINADALVAITRGVPHEIWARVVWRRPGAGDGGVFSVRSSYSDATYQTGGWHLQAVALVAPNVAS